MGSRGAPAATASGDAGRAGADGTGPVDPEPGPGGAPPGPQAGQAGQARQPAQPRVPAWLDRAAGWAWRLLILGALIYVLFRVIGTLRLVVLPCVAALLLTALLQPLTQRLRRLGLPALAATWCTVLTALAVLAGVATMAATRTSADYPRLVDGRRPHHQRPAAVAGRGPVPPAPGGLTQLSNRLLTFLKQHQSAVAGTVLSGGKFFLEILAGLVLTLFVTFFLLKDGERIWAWLTDFLGAGARVRARRAGAAAWLALTYYVRGTMAVAAIHAVVIGFALWVLGVPLLVPLVILVFLAAFVPLVGILVAGTLAVAVTLGTRGWVAALILVAVFILENQLESHLLQPLVVGRMVRLPPAGDHPGAGRRRGGGRHRGGCGGRARRRLCCSGPCPTCWAGAPTAADGPDPPGAVPRAG